MGVLFLILGITVTACGNLEDRANTTVNVEAKEVIRAGAFANFAYSGTIEESKTLPLSFPVTGTVARVFVSEGDAVKKGQLLATLDGAVWTRGLQLLVLG